MINSQLVLLQFIFINLLRAADYEQGYAVQIVAYASNGYYYLEDGETFNNNVVFSRRTPSNPRYIYKAHGLWYIATKTGAAGVFASCPKDDIRDCNADDHQFYIEYYISAYASTGVYHLTSQISTGGGGVYIRSESADGTNHARYIYKAHGLWYIAATINAPAVFANCNADLLEDCQWNILCVNAYLSNGIYKRTDEVYNDKEVYERISGGNGNKRVIYYNNKGYGWLIGSFAGSGFFARCDKENIRGCDGEGTSVIISRCSADFGVSSSLPQPILFDHKDVINNITMNTVISVISTFIILSITYCCCKLSALYKNKKHKYKTVPFEGKFQLNHHNEDELHQLQQ